MVQRIFLSGNASLDPDKWYSVRFLAERWDVHPENPLEMGFDRPPATAYQTWP